MIEEATVDAHGESELAMGWHVMLEDHLALPFETTVLGVPVTALRIDLTERDQIVATCARGRHRQRIPIVALPLPAPRPAGSEWIESCRHWCGEG
jgi:hypothetical protein